MEVRHGWSNAQKWNAEVWMKKKRHWNNKNPYIQCFLKPTNGIGLENRCQMNALHLVHRRRSVFLFSIYDFGLLFLVFFFLSPSLLDGSVLLEPIQVWELIVRKHTDDDNDDTDFDRLWTIECNMNRNDFFTMLKFLRSSTDTICITVWPSIRITLCVCLRGCRFILSIAPSDIHLMFHSESIFLGSETNLHRYILFFSLIFLFSSSSLIHVCIGIYPPFYQVACVLLAFIFLSTVDVWFTCTTCVLKIDLLIFSDRSKVIQSSKM